MMPLLVNTLTTFGDAASCSKSFFGLPTWYKYLELNNECQVINFDVPGDLLLVALAVIDGLLTIAGMVAVGFVIYGGVRYITSQGSPDETAKAQQTIINALIGLVVAVIAIAVVSFIGSKA